MRLNELNNAFYETSDSLAVCIHKSNKNPKRMVFLRDLPMLKLNNILKTMLNKILTFLYFNFSTSTSTQTYSHPKYKLKFTYYLNGRNISSLVEK